ncbi:MAG TPA: hypothetical protein VK711_00420 [Puia sp.]|nr:hypothetical protein [Puia sp.]
MKYSIILFLLFIGRVPLHPVLITEPELPAPIEIADYNDAQNDQSIFEPLYQSYNLRDSIPKSLGGEINVMDFGAKCDGITDDIIADSTACAYCIAHPYMCSTVVFPVGHTRITRPLLLQNKGNYFTIHLRGMLPAKEASDQYLSEIIFDSKSGFGIGIQSGRGIIIENLAILGKYSFPYSVNDHNIGTLRFSQWVDPTISDSRYSPYAGIVVDPYPNAGGKSVGTSGVEIRNCSVKQFMVGVCLTPNGSTLNNEMVNFIDDDIEACRVAIAIGQDQSKEIHIVRLKCWAGCHTILDGLTYGRGDGGGSVDIEGGNIAGAVNELFNLNTDRFSLSVRDIYSESLFRLGTVGKWAGANFVNLQVDFITGAGLPEPDFIVSGIANFYGGMIRYYDNDQTHRLNFTNMNSMFRDLTLNGPPITIGLIGYPNQVYPTAMFDHVNLYNFGKLLKPVFDTLIRIPKVTYLNIDSVKWVSGIAGPGLGALAKTGDYVLGGSSSGYGKYYDRYLNPNSCPTIVIGRVLKISHDSLYMGNVAVNAPENLGFDGIYLSRLK